MNIQLFRIDDRLIHGQVVIGWVNHLCSKQIILCDNSVCENDWEKELYLSIVPENLKARVLSVNELAEVLKSGEFDLSKTIILVNNPQVIEELLEQDVELEKINIGGIHFKEGRSKYLSYLYLSSEEVSSFSRLVNQGIALHCQDVPDAKKVPITNLIVN